jgi:hypothetical protein
MRGSREKFLAFDGNPTPTIEPVARHYPYGDILAECRISNNDIGIITGGESNNNCSADAKEIMKIS